MKRTLIVVLAITAGCALPEQTAEPERAETEEPEASEPEPAPEPTQAAPTEQPDSAEGLAALESELRAHLEGRDLALYVVGIEAGGGNRVRVLTQLSEEQTTEADAICNTTTVAAYGLDEIEVSGVDVAAAGGRNIAACEPRV